MRRRPLAPSLLLRSDSGQAAVELVALLPILALLALAAWQAVVVGQAAWLAAGAAGAAARASAVGGDADAAARRALTPALARGVSVEAGEDVIVRVAVRSVVGGGRVTTVQARAAFPRQSS
jgi:Flp pilus assembly protein TadG